MWHRFGMAGMDLDTFDEQFFMSIKYLFSKIFCLVLFHNLLNDIIQYFVAKYKMDEGSYQQ